MYRVIICTMFLLFFLEIIQSQNKEKQIKYLEKLTSDLSIDSSNYKLSYLKDEKTFILEVSSKGVSKSYKFLEKDIHPEGVFFDEQKKSYTLKILSIDNGHRFIFTKLKNNGVRRSNTTNIIVLKGISFEKKEALKKLIYNFRSYRKSLIKKEPESSKIFVTKPKLN